MKAVGFESYPEINGLVEKLVAFFMTKLYLKNISGFIVSILFNAYRSNMPNYHKESEKSFTVNFEERIDIAGLWFCSIMVFHYFLILSFYENSVNRLNRYC